MANAFTMKPVSIVINVILCFITDTFELVTPGSGSCQLSHPTPPHNIGNYLHSACVGSLSLSVKYEHVIGPCDTPSYWIQKENLIRVLVSNRNFTYINEEGLQMCTSYLPFKIQIAWWQARKQIRFRIFWRHSSRLPTSDRCEWGGGVQMRVRRNLL